jgi:hypothetical protein
LPIVRALAGDSTMTSDVLPGVAGGPSSMGSSAARFPRALFPRAGAALPVGRVARFFAVVLDLLVFLVAMVSY